MQSNAVFRFTNPLRLVNFNPLYMLITNKNKAITDPELNGKPTLFTKKISKALK